ncbi:integrin alpha [Limibaculum sp. FT325]|uniref:integrin alpha n=1 Tax=Thermohalobaculum sediminis TaxID=2939436 RepID=UPI0020BDEFA9|nr:integrin alpha [Limibaculum sediminis]MCL5776344.1 integrin alpha [Limibaculum sediminis]
MSFAVAGDVNGDGWADFMIGADLANDGSRVDAGAVYLVHGGPGILAALDALDGAIDSVIELARVGSSVTVETVFAPAPQSNLAPPPVTEMDNDPDTAPALRGPYDMIADDSVARLGAGPSVAVKPRAGRDGSAVPDGDAPAAEAAEAQATRAWSGTGADASRPRGGIDRWEPGDDSFDFAAMGDGEAARSAVLHPLAEDWRMSTGSGAGTESHDAGIEPADAIQFPVPDDGANWDGLL